MAKGEIHRVSLEDWHAALQRDPSRDTRPKYPTGELVKGDDVVRLADEPEGTEHRLFWAFLASEVPRVWRAVVEDVRPDRELGELVLVRRHPPRMG